MTNREPDPRFESEYHSDGERLGWNAYNGESDSERRSQQRAADDWYERNNRRNQAHLQHHADHTHYDPDINRGFEESPEAETWREGTRFTDREQDYRGGRWNREVHGYHDGDGRDEYSSREFGPQRYGSRFRERELERGHEPERWREPAYYRNPESREYADYSGGSTERDYPGGTNTFDTGYIREYNNHFGRGASPVPSPRGMSFAGIAPKNYQRSDARIEEDICERLTADPFVDPSNIEIKVVQGEAILTGDVANRRMKRLAEDIADETPGVQNVNNQIHVIQQQPGMPLGTPVH